MAGLVTTHIAGPLGAVHPVGLEGLGWMGGRCLGGPGIQTATGKSHWVEGRSVEKLNSFIL